MNEPRGWTEILAMTDRVEIYRCGMENGAPLNDDRVDVTEPTEVRELMERLAVTDEVSEFHGPGHVTFRLLAGEGELTTVVLHEGVALRGEHWDGGATLEKSARLIAWLARREVSLSAILAGRIKEQRAQNAEARQRTLAARDAWIEAIPPALEEMRPHFLATEAAGSVPEPMLDEADRKLAAAVPDETDRCVALLAWLGTGTGRLREQPAYEDIADELVKRLPLSAVKAALKGDPSRAVRLGAARHLAGRGRNKKDLAGINERVIGQLVSEAKLAGWTQVAEALRERVR